MPRERRGQTWGVLENGSIGYFRTITLRKESTGYDLDDHRHYIDALDFRYIFHIASAFIHLLLVLAAIILLVKIFTSRHSRRSH